MHANRNALVAVVSLLALVGCAAQNSEQTTSSPTLRSRQIDLGRDVFASGSVSMTAAGTESVLARLAEVSPGSLVAIEVFADLNSLKVPHTRRENAERLAQLRATALSEFVRAQGFEIVSANGRGFDRVNGMEPNRRTLLLVVEK